MLRQPPASTLFPYTTLFRSSTHPDASRSVCSTSTTTGPRSALMFIRTTIGLPPELSCGSSERSEEHTSELQSHSDLVCRLLLEKKKQKNLTEIVLMYNEQRS